MRQLIKVMALGTILMASSAQAAVSPRNACGAAQLKGYIVALYDGYVKEASRACAKGVSTTPAAINSASMEKLATKIVKSVNNSITKYGSMNCELISTPVNEADIPAIAASLESAAATLAADLCDGP